MINLQSEVSEINNFQDLESFLNDFEIQLRDTYKNENLVEYQWKELLTETNNRIEKIISNTPCIKLKVSDIKKQKFSSSIYFSTFFEESHTKMFEYKKLRGEDFSGKWKRPSFEDNETDIFVISYELPKIKDSQLGPYIRKGQHENSVPKINFITYTDVVDVNLKVGSEYLFNLNSVGIIRYLGKEEIFELNYFENFLKPKVNTKTNPNCFIVTTTMGDVNHPVVVDFRKFRDEVMLKNTTGRISIKIYYSIGPFLSNIIKRNNLLLVISRKVIMFIHNKFIN